MTIRRKSFFVRFGRALLLPFHFVQIVTRAKSFRDNPVIGSRWLNAKGLHVLRIRAAHVMTAFRRRRLARHISPELRAQFDENGFITIPDFMPDRAFARMQQAILDHAAPAREMVQGDTITRRIAIDPAMLNHIPELSELLRDKRWRGLMHYVSSVRREPLYYVQAILSHRRDAPPDPQETLHSDTFHPNMKAWLFLTDVGEDQGAFTYVPGSHRASPERLAWEKRQSCKDPADLDRLSARGSMRIAAEELPSLNLPAPQALAVRANTLVVADTFGFHARGHSSAPGVRVEVWAYCRPNPFLPWNGFSLSKIPAIAYRRIGWRWSLRDAFAGVLGQPWRLVGRLKPGSN